jgi:hypothetical protein
MTEPIESDLFAIAVRRIVGQPTLPLLDNLRLERADPVARHGE